MPVKYRSHATTTNTAGTNSNSIVVTKPSQVADGDILIAVTAGPINTVTPPAGWTYLGQDTDTDHQSNVYMKIAASEGASYTFGFSSSECCMVSIVAFMGGHTVLNWNVRSTAATNPAAGRAMDAARDCVSWHLFTWKDTATATMAGSFGSEKHDVVSNNSGATVFRGMAGYYYGPPDQDDIINIGDAIPTISVTQSQAVQRGLYHTFLISEKEPDTEGWDDTDGEFAVELNLDKATTDATGGLTSLFRGDVTGLVVAMTESGENPPDETTEKLLDGLTTTKWLTNAATAFIQYDFGADNPQTVKRYRMTSANDFEARDPMTWTVRGSNNGTDYTILDSRSNESFGNRFETREFTMNTATGSYRYYRLIITANKSSGSTAVTQLAEWRLSTIDVWEDITTFVNEESKIRIVRGLQGSSGRSDFTRSYVELNNTDGRFSLRNSAGAYYGALQRNNEMRISKAYGTKSLQLQGEVQLEGTNMCGDGARCPLTDALAVGTIDLRIDLEPESWRQEQALAGISTYQDGPASWKFTLLADGRLQFYWEDSGGPTEAERTAVSSESVPASTRKAVRVTQDVGIGTNTVTFYTADTIAGPWTQLGDAWTIAYTTQPLYEGGALCVGHVGSQDEPALHGMVYHFELRSGIDGTLVSDVDFTALTNGAHAWTDDDGNEWVTVNNAVVSNRRYRFHGEVSEWPLAWDTTGTWITASATGAGVQKRLERGNAPASAMRRYHTKGIITDPGAFERHATPYAYWPMEDHADTYQIASGLPSKPGMQIYGTPIFDDANGDAFHESGTLIRLAGAKFGGRVTGNPNDYADIRWLHYSPDNMAAGVVVLEMFGTGTVRRWEVTYEASNTWRVRGYDENDAGTVAWDSGNRTVTTNAEKMHIQLILDFSGGINIGVTMNAYDVYGTSLGTWTDTFLIATLGRIYRINVDKNANIGNTMMGHLALYGEDSPTFAGGELNAHHYEPAGERIQRLCREEDIDFRFVGELSDTAFMGFQTADTPFAAMSSAAVSDDGFLVDPLDHFGVEYHTGRSIQNQAAHITLSYTGNELSGELRPTVDDSYIVNDYTANRGEAGGARYVRSDGPLSVEPPPLGVGPYPDEQSFSLAHEGQCVDIASWQVHKGTVDEERFPRIELALENLRIAADAALTERLLLLDIGKRLDITDGPDFLPSDDIRQIVIGYEEWFDHFQHNFKLNTIPERIFETAMYDGDDRFAEHDSTLYQDISAAATTLEVVNQVGLSWSETASDFDILIDGERMTVTAVALPDSAYTTDSFDRANSAVSLGSADGGTTSAWTAQINTWGIISNTAYSPIAGNSLATIPGSADFEEVSVEVPTWPATREAWINFRYSDSSNRWRWGGTLADDARLEKVVAGVVTSYDADADGNNFVLAAGDKLSARAHGSVIEVFVNDVLALCISDTFNESATLVGLQTANNDTRFNNFRWISANPDQELTVTRGVGASTAVHHKAGADVALYKTPYRGL